MIIETQPDKEKAKALRNIAKITLNRLSETDKTKYPSNSLTDYYDIIRKLLDALNILDGIKFKGEGAHIESINYACEKYKINDADKQLINDMREYRNRISYEGFNIKPSFIEQNYERIERLINRMMSKIGQLI